MIFYAENMINTVNSKPSAQPKRIARRGGAAIQKYLNLGKRLKFFTNIIKVSVKIINFDKK
ncbi:MAG: hypothetical protein K2K29_04705, partial [Muribaculaceae bacterium]|nr:hypothetical protein [Muribaculaceae bacterium]